MKKVIFILIGSFVVGVALLPTVISMDWAKNLIVNEINRELPGKLSIGQVQLSWLGHQTLDNIHFQDKDGMTSLSVDQASTNSSLWSLLWSQGIPNSVHIQNLNATIHDLSEPVKLENVQMDVDFRGRLDQMMAKASGKTSQGGTNGAFHLNAEVGENENVELMATHFPVLVLDELVSRKFPELQGALLESLGEQIEIQAAGNLQKIQLNATSPQSQANLTASIVGDKIIVDTPAQLKLQLPPTAWKMLTQGKAPALEHPMNIDVQIENAIYHPQEWLKSSLVGEITLGHASFSPHPDFGQIQLNGMTAKLLAPEGEKNIDLTLNGAATQNGSPMKLEFGATILKPDVFKDVFTLIKKGTTYHLDFAGLPENIHLVMSGQTDKDQTLARVDFDSEKVKFDGMELKIDGFPWEEVAEKGVKAPISGEFYLSHYQLTPEQIINDVVVPFSIDAKANKIKLELKGKSEAHGSNLAGHLVIEDWMHPSGVDFSKSKTDANFDLKEIPVRLIPYPGLKDWLGESVDLKGIAKTGYGVRSFVDFNLDSTKGKANVKVTKDDQKIDFDIVSHLNGSAMDFKGFALNAFDAEGKFSLENMTLDLDAKTNGFPLPLLCRFACPTPEIEKMLMAFLGPYVDGNLKMNWQNMNGPFMANFKGENGHVYVEGHLQQGVLTLNSPAQANVKVSPAFADLLDDFIPLLSSVVDSENPITVVISPENFAIPLHNFDKNNVTVSQISVDLGRLHFSSQGKLADVLSILKVNVQDTFSVWFTPIYLSAHNGTVDIARFDMLISDAYPIATWGNVDFPTDYVKMNIGLSGQALSKAFGIPNLGLSYMMTVPMRGPIDNPTIDRTKVTARLAAIIAAAAGGPQGILVGAVINAATGAYTSDKAPPPTTDPLPWDNSADEPKSSIPNPIKGVQKGASKLIRSFLGN